MTNEEFHATRLVEFRDTDAAGIIHFTALFAYMESVEHEFLRSLGASVLQRDAEGDLSWPRVAARLDFTGPVRFEDLLDITLRIARLGTKSVTYEFRFHHEGRQIACGEMTAVCCRLLPGGPESTPIPADLAERLQPFAAAEA